MKCEKCKHWFGRESTFSSGEVFKDCNNIIANNYEKSVDSQDGCEDGEREAPPKKKPAKQPKGAGGGK